MDLSDREAMLRGLHRATVTFQLRAIVAALEFAAPIAPARSAEQRDGDPSPLQPSVSSLPPHDQD